MSKKSESAPKYAEYDESKLWFERKGSVLTIGLTTRCIEEVGEIQSIDFPDEGEDYAKGDVMITIEGSSGAIEVTAPAAGVIESLNEDVKDASELINEDPMEGGWLLKLEVQDLSDLKEFISDELDVSDLSDDEDDDDTDEGDDDEEDEEDDEEDLDEDLDLDEFPEEEEEDDDEDTEEDSDVDEDSAPKKRTTAKPTAKNSKAKKSKAKKF